MSSNSRDVRRIISRRRDDDDGGCRDDDGRATLDEEYFV